MRTRAFLIGGGVLGVMAAGALGWAIEPDEAPADAPAERLEQSAADLFFASDASAQIRALVAELGERVEWDGEGVAWILPTDPPQVLVSSGGERWRMPVIPMGERAGGMNVELGEVDGEELRQRFRVLLEDRPELAERLVERIGTGDRPLNLDGFDLMWNREASVWMFRAERERLGDGAFVEQLAAWVGDEPRERAYWAGMCLTEPTLLGGDAARPFVAIALWSEAATVLDTGVWEDEMSAIALRAQIALAAHTLGLDATAVEHKSWVQERMDDGNRYVGSFPVMSEAERAVYKSIPVER